MSKYTTFLKNNWPTIAAAALGGATAIGSQVFKARSKSLKDEFNTIVDDLPKLKTITKPDVAALANKMMPEGTKDVSFVDTVDKVVDDKKLLGVLTRHGIDPKNKKMMDLLMIGSALTDGNKYWVLHTPQTRLPIIAHELAHIKNWKDGITPTPAPRVLETFATSLFNAKTLREEQQANETALKFIKEPKAKEFYNKALKSYKSKHYNRRGDLFGLLGGITLGASVGKLIKDNLFKKASVDGAVVKTALQLQPHQQRTVNKALRSPHGVIAIHGTGTGKTLTSIAAGLKHNGPVEVVVPAPLVDNYKKELSKHLGHVPAKFNVRSLQSAINKPSFKRNSMLIVDEAQRIRNPQSQAYQTLMKHRPSFKKVVLLTASPLYNKPTDLAPLVNLVKNKNVLPTKEKDFNKKFTKKKSSPFNFFRHMLGLKIKKSTGLQNKSLLRSSLKGIVDYHFNPTNNSNFPTKHEEIKRVPMSHHQQMLYDYASNKVPKVLQYKIKNMMPLSRKESGQMNAFLTAVRKISNTPLGYLKGVSVGNSAAHSPKINTMFRDLKTEMTKNPKHKAIVYSTFIDSGLKSYSSLLKRNGIKHKLFTGAESKPVKASIVQAYNKGKIPVLLISSSGTEGLDTKGTRQIQIMEPHFNKEKIKQVIGRGVRFKSHAHLPTSQRSVKVQHYLSTRHRPASIGAAVSRVFSRNKGPQVDEYLHTTSQSKDKLNQSFLKEVKRASTPGLVSRIFGRKK